ncbi:integrator complex subunit 14-like [Liolophura sinensis]|uniref:integrator complex subunit 14-like n=1 Tax=Liolophura sinensis TaxID=3198878 RepID=UPI003158B23A
MPTVIALDVSLSMNRPVPMADCTEEYQRRHLAIHGINSLLDYMSTNYKLEFTSMVIFSYLWEQLVSFTRDYETIKTALAHVEGYNKTCLETTLSGIASLISDEWGSTTSSQVILVTDGNAGTGPGSLRHSLNSLANKESRGPEEKFPLPFAFPCKLHVVCISNPGDGELNSSLPLYQQLIDMNGRGGEVFVPEGQLSLRSVQQVFLRLGETYYTPYYGLLRCGNLKCQVNLFPPPETYVGETEFTKIQQTVSDELSIIGFLDIADIASPQIVSRHLVVPSSSQRKEKSAEENGNAGESKDTDEELNTSSSRPEDGKTPSFTVLLHGSLKVEGMVALTKLSENWFGILYSWADSKKKSNLMLSLLEPGAEALSWLGNMNHLGPSSDFSVPPYGEDDVVRSPFPVRPQDKRSYAQSCVVWIKPSGLQADLQKVLRHARKLPDKQQQFYKELNRIRRAALSFGFVELLDAMANMLDRECTILPHTTHPDAALQLTHVANILRSDMARDIAQPIMPLRTNFSADDQ